MEIFNDLMSVVCVFVEWLFVDIINYFKFLDFKKDLKIGLSQVGKMYIVCVLFRNVLICFYFNFIVEYFGFVFFMLDYYFSQVFNKDKGSVFYLWKGRYLGKQRYCKSFIFLCVMIGFKMVRMFFKNREI